MIRELVVATQISIHALAPSSVLLVLKEQRCSRIPSQYRLESKKWRTAPDPPVIKSTGNTTICKGQVAILTASPFAHRYAWFKDGQPLLQQGGRLVVAEAGSYSVLAIDEQGNRSAESQPMNITTLPKPQKPVVLGRRSGCDGEVIILKVEDQVDGAVEFEWHREMESAPFARGSNIKYIIQGDAVLYVTAISAAGCISDEIETVEIKSSTPQGTFQVSDQAIKKGELVAFTSRIKNAASYLWNFGDGQISYEKDPKHYFHHAGFFPISLSVRSSDGCERVFSSTEKLQVSDIVELPPKPGVPAPGDAFDPSGQEWRIGPNPFHNQLTIFFDSPKADKAIIAIFNLYGSLVHSEAVAIVPGTNVISINTLDRLAKGSYVVRVKSSSFSRTERLIKL